MTKLEKGKWYFYISRDRFIFVYKVKNIDGYTIFVRQLLTNNTERFNATWAMCVDAIPVHLHKEEFFKALFKFTLITD